MATPAACLSSNAAYDRNNVFARILRDERAVHEGVQGGLAGRANFQEDDEPWHRQARSAPRHTRARPHTERQP
jgi:hypothetical protein